MDGRTELTAEVTPELLAAAASPMIRALMWQHWRWLVPYRARIAPMQRKARVAGLALCALGLPLAAVLSATRGPGRGFAAALGVLLLLLLFVFWQFERVRGRVRTWSCRSAGRAIARGVSGLIARDRREAPYPVGYEIAGSSVRVHTPKLRRDTTLQLTEFRLAYEANGFFHLLFDPSRLPLGRTIFVPPGSDAAAALRAAIERAGIPIEPVPAEPPPGY